MPQPHNKALEQAKRRAQVAELYLKGLTQWEIARRLRITQGTVSKDLKALQEQWSLSGVRNLDAWKEQELAKIDQLERTYWEAWDRSCKPATKTRKKRSVTVEKNKSGEEESIPSGPIEETTEREGRDGNPTFLAGVQWCINRRCELLDLDPPKRMAHGGDSNAPPISTKGKIEIDLSKLTTDELRSLRDLRAKLAGTGES